MAVYCGGCRDKHACLCWDSILASLLPRTTVIIVDVLCILLVSQATVHQGIIGTGWNCSTSCVVFSFCVYWLFLHANCSMALRFFYFVQSEERKEDFSHLPPNQQEKQLKLKIDELKSNYAKELAARFCLSCCFIWLWSGFEWSADRMQVLLILCT